MSYETPLTIAEVMKDITKNRYVLPSIQREFVWDTDQIETLFDNYQTFNGKRSIILETMISIITKQKGNNVWMEWLIEQPDALIKDPFYDCEYATNREIQTILSIDLIKAKEWIANNFEIYKNCADNRGIKLFIPWLEQ